MELTDKQIETLNAKLPDWAVSQHPTKKFLSVINRLNEVFGVGVWNYEVEKVGHERVNQGKREAWEAAAKGTLTVGSFSDEGSMISLEQFGGSINDDLGDAYKGAGTDALTKISSYLGIGASIYKGKGNVVEQGLGKNEWAKVRDTYVAEGQLNPEDYEQCSHMQKLVLDEFTKAKRKNNGE
jgi:hypothetical protein